MTTSDDAASFASGDFSAVDDLKAAVALAAITEVVGVGQVDVHVGLFERREGLAEDRLDVASIESTGADTPASRRVGLRGGLGEGILVVARAGGSAA